MSSEFPSGADRTKRGYDAVTLSVLAALSVTVILERLARLFARRAQGENVDMAINAHAGELARRRKGDASMKKM